MEGDLFWREIRLHNASLVYGDMSVREEKGDENEEEDKMKLTRMRDTALGARFLWRESGLFSLYPSYFKSSIKQDAHIKVNEISPTNLDRKKEGEMKLQNK